MFSLSPGESRSFGYFLNEWYEFSLPGEYTIDAKISYTMQTDNAPRARFEYSDRLALHVLPCDPQRLEDLCASLAASAISAARTDVAEALTAAQALSFVRDPLAVPDLARVLKEGGVVRSEALPGLVRIGTPEAVAVLRSGLESADPDLRPQIEAALYEIRTGTKLEVTD